MGIVSGLKAWIVGIILERPVKGLTLAELGSTLQTSGQQIEQRFGAARDTSANRRRVCEIIGIERWGQKRLMVALGKPLPIDKYNDYEPSPDKPLQDLTSEFRITRQETIDLVQQIEKTGAGDARIMHNPLGDLSVRGWLRYLNMHANMESKSVK